MKTPLLLLALSALASAASPEPKFHAVAIDDKIQIGYGLAIADVDGDGKPDILLADKRQFVWYRNPGPEKAGDPAAWVKSVLAENLTPKDNVCLAAQDIDGDGKCEVAVGAEWNPGDTEKSGAVFYLIPPADRTKRWEAVKLHAEPTTHRMRWIKLEDGTWGLVVLPLHGRANKDGEGAPVKVLLYRKPADPRSEWKTEVIAESMHMTHNLEVTRPNPAKRFRKTDLFLAGREGIAVVTHNGKNWQSLEVPNVGNEKGAGEVRAGHFPGDHFVLATVEPMHGNALVVHDMSPGAGQSLWPDKTLTDKLVEGHALACGDMLGAGSDQIVVGWRGNPSQPQAKVGVAIWTALDTKGENWRETLVDDGGMACEDLQLADLNGDGKLDIIASGRATKNVKIYFNETPPR